MRIIFSKALKPALFGFLAVALLLNWTSIGIAFEKVNQTFWGVAIKGYDTVAYHTEHSIFEYIEVFCNRQRRHSTLEYLCPSEYEKQKVKLCA